MTSKVTKVNQTLALTQPPSPIGWSIDAFPSNMCGSLSLSLSRKIYCLILLQILKLKNVTVSECHIEILRI